MPWGPENHLIPLLYPGHKWGRFHCQDQHLPSYQQLWAFCAFPASATHYQRPIIKEARASRQDQDVQLIPELLSPIVPDPSLGQQGYAYSPLIPLPTELMLKKLIEYCSFLYPCLASYRVPCESLLPGLCKAGSGFCFWRLVLHHLVPNYLSDFQTAETYFSVYVSGLSVSCFPRLFIPLCAVISGLFQWTNSLSDCLMKAFWSAKGEVNFRLLWLLLTVGIFLSMAHTDFYCFRNDK